MANHPNRSPRLRRRRQWVEFEYRHAIAYCKQTHDWVQWVVEHREHHPAMLIEALRDHARVQAWCIGFASFTQ